MRAPVSSKGCSNLVELRRLEEAKALQRKMMPVARRVLGDSDDITLKMRFGYARAFYKDKGATLDDLRECVTTLEETERTARRVFGGTHPTTVDTERALQSARSMLAVREIVAAPNPMTLAELGVELEGDDGELLDGGTKVEFCIDPPPGSREVRVRKA